MELADYLKVLRRRWWMVLLAMVLCVAGAAGASYLQKPRFTTAVQLLVAGSANETSTDELVARQLAAQRAGAYSLLLGTAPAVSEVASRVGAAASHPAVTAAADGTSPFITLTVTADTAQAAQAIANGYAPLIPEIVAKLEQRPTTSSVTITAMSPAALPSVPSSPQPVRNMSIGLVLGLILGLVGALTRESLDARLRDSAEIERFTGVTLLGSIPKEHGGDVLPSLTRPRSGRAEAYRHVRTNLEFTSAEGMPRSVVVTSPAPGEGKSSLSANLAIVAARSGRNVVLVDADLRKPSVAKYFGLQSSVGLADVLSGRWRWQEALVPVDGERIHILTSGPIPRFPSELVGSAAMSDLIQQLEAHFDFVIIDTPPVLPVSDALVIGVNVDGVIVVARMVETRRAALRRAVDAVRKVNANLLGIVGNAVVKQEEKAYGEGYGYAYGYLSDAAADPAPLPSLQPAERRDPTTRSRRGRHATPTTGSEAQAVPPLLGQVPAQPWPGATAPPAAPFHEPVYPPQQGHPEQGHAQQGPSQQPPMAQAWPEAQAYQPPSPQPGFAAPAVPPDPVRWGSGSAAVWPAGAPQSPVEPMRLDDIFRQPPRP